MLSELALPDEAVDYYRKNKECILCKACIRHEVHLFNHFKRSHRSLLGAARPESGPSYFVWNGSTWIQVDMKTCLGAMLQHRATAITKRRSGTIH